MIIVAVAAIAAAALFLLVNLQTYTKARVSDTYKIRGVSDSNYEEFAGGSVEIQQRRCLVFESKRRGTVESAVSDKKIHL